MHTQSLDKLTSNDIRTVYRSLWDTRSKWYDIGIELKISIDELDAIHSENGDNIGDCLRSVIQNYLSNPSRTKSWSEIICTLRSPIIGYAFLANVLESKFLSMATHKSVAEVAATPGILIDIILMLLATIL